MSLPGWPHEEPPFHRGEQEVQQRAGVRERMAQVGERAVRAAMPDQHREFFPLLPFVVLGAVDAGGQPWATLLAGADVGFVRSIDAAHLRVDALPPANDPLEGLLLPAAALGLLGIELQTRRRNRANGHITQRDERGFMLHVEQSFGNCPKYIQRRDALRRAPSTRNSAQRAARLGALSAARLRRADTFFIATHAALDTPSAGSDVSHRGGLPGFVDVTDDGQTLTWPDFVGNSFYNTLGNIAIEPRVGLVFPDFETGDLLHVAGHAEIVWNGHDLAAFAGAERLVRMRVSEVLFRPAALPLRWRLAEVSPALQGTGVW
jgi:predicted pyridoxine 5'-phosphate oxidase superfamily flavin-nucleotide-binding protein